MEKIYKHFKSMKPNLQKGFESLSILRRLSMYTQLLIFTFFILLIILVIQFSINSVNSTDDGFFVVPEEEFYDPEDYGIESSFSSQKENSSDKFRSEVELYNATPKFTDSIKPSDFNFAVAGDWGCTKNTEKTVDSIQIHDPELVFNLGDTSYEKDMNCWIDIVKPISDRMKAVIGNHDVMSPNLLDQHMKKFGLNKPYYSFDYNNIHFLMLSSESSYIPGLDPDFSDLENTEQYQFVKSDLSNASKNPAIKWIIAMSHRQYYSSLCGDHDSCEPIKKLRDAYHPLFEKYGVDLLFSGHAHNYQRTYPLFYNDINSSQPIIEEKHKKGYNISSKGMSQIIVGTGGIDFDDFSNQEPYVVYQQDSQYGFLNVDLIDQGNILLGRYYSNTGDVLDEFKIVK